jgi:hypothetical protein
MVVGGGRTSMSAAPISGMPEGVSLTGAGVLRVCPQHQRDLAIPDSVGEIHSFPLASCSDPQSLHGIFSPVSRFFHIFRRARYYFFKNFYADL